MANGDISVEQMAEWSKDKPVSDKLDIIYLILKNQSHTCTKRPDECNKRYVLREWVVRRVFYLSGAASIITFIGFMGVVWLLRRLFGMDV